MKTNLIQREIFASMMRENKKLVGTKMSETETAFTYDGLRGFVLPNSIINFNLEKVNMFDTMEEMFIKTPEDKLLILTKELVLLQNKKEMARKLKCQQGELFEVEDGIQKNEIWVNSKFVEYFENPQFYANSSVKRVLVYEPKVSDRPCAVIMPIRVRI